jgi:peroxiredoxin
MAVLAGCAKGPVTGSARLKVGDVAPTFTLPALMTNEEFIMARMFQDNVATVVVIWSMTCPTCREAMTECERIYRQYTGQTVAFLGVNFDAENINGVRAFLKAEAITFPNAWDPRSRAARGYRSLDYTFSVFVVDRDRQLKWVQYDHPPDLAVLLAQAIDKTVAEAVRENTRQK